MPSILDIEKKEWKQLPVKEGDVYYSTANAITNSRKYIVGTLVTAKDSEIQR